MKILILLGGILAKIFDELIVAVAENPQKGTLFNVEERVEMVRESLGDFPSVKVESFGNLLIDYLKEENFNFTRLDFAFDAIEGLANTLEFSPRDFFVAWRRFHQVLSRPSRRKLSKEWLVLQ